MLLAACCLLLLLLLVLLVFWLTLLLIAHVSSIPLLTGPKKAKGGEMSPAQKVEPRTLISYTLFFLSTCKLMAQFLSPPPSQLCFLLEHTQLQPGSTQERRKWDPREPTADELYLKCMHRCEQPGFEHHTAHDNPTACQDMEVDK